MGAHITPKAPNKSNKDHLNYGIFILKKMKTLYDILWMSADEVVNLFRRLGATLSNMIMCDGYHR